MTFNIESSGRKAKLTKIHKWMSATAQELLLIRSEENIYNGHLTMQHGKFNFNVNKKIMLSSEINTRQWCKMATDYEPVSLEFFKARSYIR